MLRGQSPWGLGRGGIFVRFVRSFVDVRGRQCFPLGFGDVIECRASMLDRTGALIGEQCSSSRYREGVPTVVVFEISPSHVKTFYHCPQRSQPPPPGPIARCVTSLRWL